LLTQQKQPKNTKEYEPKGWLWNAARTFYTDIISLATAARAVFLQDKDGTIAFLGDSPAYHLLFNTNTAEVAQSTFDFALNNSNPASATAIMISASHRGSGGLAGTNEFVGDLGIGATFTLQTVAGEGIDALTAEYKVSGTITIIDDFTYRVPIVLINGNWNTIANMNGYTFWFDFHQAAGDTVYPTLAVVTDNIDLDWDGLKGLKGVGILNVSANATVTFLNATAAEIGMFNVNISNDATLTFITSLISGDDRLVSDVLTLGNGIFPISIDVSALILNVNPTPAI